jgi:hypothetical protein
VIAVHSANNSRYKYHHYAHELERQCDRCLLLVVLTSHTAKLLLHVDDPDPPIHTPARVTFHPLDPTCFLSSSKPVYRATTAQCSCSQCHHLCPSLTLHPP